MLRYYSGYLYDNGPYEEEDEDDSSEEDESSNEDDEWDENRRSCLCNDDLRLCKVTSPGWHPGQDEDDELDHDNHDRVCLCDPTDIREVLAVVIIQVWSAMENVMQTDMKGGSRH